jgi:lipopolysaccharide biosynthesis glycosyltransferase
MTSTISFVVPRYKSTHLLRECIDSILGQPMSTAVSSLFRRTLKEMFNPVTCCNERLKSEGVRRPLVLASDEAYAMPLATTLRSIAEANRSSWPLEFHVLCNGLCEDTRVKVFNSLPKESAAIRWIPVDVKLFGGFREAYYVSKMTYARLLIPSIFPDTVSRVLYLDTDLLVLDDLGPLWETDLGGAIVGAVSDFFFHTAFVAEGLDPELMRAEPRYGGLPRVRDYFNAGVLLIDLDRWRENRISEKALEYLTRHSASPYFDQDALNFVCDNRWKKLDPRWNVQDHKKRIVESRRGIVHFVSDSKPWNVRAGNPNAGFYDAFRSRTCFARTPLDKLSDSSFRLWVRCKNVLRRCGFRKRRIQVSRPSMTP